MKRLSHRRPCERGQASIELVALIPVIVIAVAAVVQVLAAGTARERASAAAEAGAVAMLQDADPRAAVEAALGGSLDRADFEIEGRHVRVTVRPRAFAKPLGELLAATSRADAGPQPDPVARTVVRGGDGDSARPEGARLNAARRGAARPGARPDAGRPRRGRGRFTP